MNVDELRAHIAAGAPAWDERIADVAAAAVALAWASRPTYSPETLADAKALASQAQAGWRALPDFERRALGRILAETPGAYWELLSATKRSAYFVLAFRAVAG